MLRRIGWIVLLIVSAMPGYAQNDSTQEWRKQIHMRLDSNKRMPPNALGQRGTVKVGFVVDRKGTLISRWLEESTGIPALDDVALAIIERAQPFPAPPPDLDEDRLRQGISFIFGPPPAGYRDSSPDIGKHQEILHGEAAVAAKMRSICRGC